MRRPRRRRPAGLPQVPADVLASPHQPARALEPIVVRIGPDHTLLDAPWGLVAHEIAHIWSDETAPGGLARRAWPRDPWSNRPLAPLDLHLGHVLELSAPPESQPDVRYACVADVNKRYCVLVAAASAYEAISMARRAVDAWRATELSVVEEAWRARIAAAQRQPDSSR